MLNIDASGPPDQEPTPEPPSLPQEVSVQCDMDKPDTGIISKFRRRLPSWVMPLMIVSTIMLITGGIQASGPGGGAAGSSREAADDQDGVTMTPRQLAAIPSPDLAGISVVEVVDDTGIVRMLGYVGFNRNPSTRTLWIHTDGGQTLKLYDGGTSWALEDRSSNEVLSSHGPVKRLGGMFRVICTTPQTTELIRELVCSTYPYIAREMELSRCNVLPGASTTPAPATPAPTTTALTTPAPTTPAPTTPAPTTPAPTTPAPTTAAPTTPASTTPAPTAPTFVSQPLTNTNLDPVEIVNGVPTPMSIKGQTPAPTVVGQPIDNMGPGQGPVEIVNGVSTPGLKFHLLFERMRTFQR
jgi:hypothetical protein